MKLKINETELVVTECYPYRYATGKEVLRFKVNANDIDFITLKTLLEGNTLPIEFFENDTDTVPKCVYYAFSEFSVSYNNGTYSVEQACVSTIEAEMVDLRNTVDSQAEELQLLNETLLEILMEG